MKEHQAREIIFETVIKQLLGKSRYVSIIEEKLYGRSGDHEVSSYFTLNMNSAFSYPTRVVSMYKYYAKRKVELYHIRDFSGIVGDISEYNLSTKNYNAYCSGTNIANRFNDVGCYFSTTAYSRSAQEYAWAHSIFLVSIEKIEIIQPLLKTIEDFVSSLNENTMNNITRSELINGYEIYYNNLNVNYMNIDVFLGVINCVYPVLIIGPSGSMDSIILEAENSLNGSVIVEQATRIQNSFETKLDVIIKDSNLEFALPNVVVEKLMERTDNDTKDNVMFKLDIPYISRSGRKSFATCQIRIEGFSRSEYSFEQMTLF